jgi:lipopolysaccharide assembly outer membrane protein LptD (OstA)
VSKTSQSSNPFFVPETKVPQSRLRQLSLDNVVLDSADRIPTANILSAGLGNRFYTGAGSRRRLLAELDLSAAYDFAGPGEFGLAIAEGQLLPWRRMRAKFNVAYDLDKTRIEQGLFDVAVSLRDVLGLLQSSRLSFGYRYRQAVGLFFESFEDITRVEDLGGGFRRFKNEFTRINQLTAGTRLRFNENWAINYNLGYSFQRNVLLTNRGAIEYTSRCRCWAVQALIEEDRTRGLRGGVNFTFLGFGMDLSNPFKDGGMLGTGTF